MSSHKGGKLKTYTLSEKLKYVSDYLDYLSQCQATGAEVTVSKRKYAEDNHLNYKTFNGWINEFSAGRLKQSSIADRKRVKLAEREYFELNDLDFLQIIPSPKPATPAISIQYNEEAFNQRRCRFDRLIKNVAVVGGTHGNEVHGVYLVREIEALKAVGEIQQKYSTIHLEALIANPSAVEARGTGNGRRYIDKDLNRCFLFQDLENNTSSIKRALEEKRAKEIDRLLGPKSSPMPATDFIVDVHSTTSNTGVLILCHPRDNLSISLAHQLKKRYCDISIALWNEGDVALLPSIARSGITLEVGPVPHSTAVCTLYKLTRSIVWDIMGLIDMHNLTLNQSSSQLAAEGYSDAVATVFQRYCSLGFPRDGAGNIIGFVHPSLHGIPELQNNSCIDHNTCLFELLDGSILTLDTCKDFCTMEYSIAPEEGYVELLYPMFINEAAYYEKDIAMLLVVKRTISTKELISINM